MTHQKKTNDAAPSRGRVAAGPRRQGAKPILPLSPTSLIAWPAYASSTAKRQNYATRLQRRVGNRVATSLLQPTAVQIGQAAQENQLQREDEDLDRDWLIQRIAFRMGLAFNKYVDAANAKKKAMQDAAKAEAEMFGLFLDVLLTFATPGLGKLVSSAISKSVSVEAPMIVYKLADKALDRSDQIVSASLALGKKGVSKAVDEILKQNETEKFIDALKEAFSVVLDDTHAALPEKSDEELAVLYTNYDPSIATKALYVSKIDQIVGYFQRQVEPVGKGRLEVSQAHVLSTKNWATWIKMDGGTYLALVEHVTTATFGVNKQPKFLNWIGNEMRDLAIAKTKQLSGQDIQTIPESDVRDMP
ncbi:MAG: hypothetical protein KDE59_26000 [Anaerolineales bacterium]|nr:hypothetical protein [Anaerolineales bacterium]MCB0030246.1 hypothetical protein [Anaerolineales bacterium]